MGEAKDRVVIVEDVNDSELHYLYERALFTIFPSLAEGWGLPVAESVAMGKLCLASNRDSIPEVAGDLIPYFDPANLDQMVELLRRYICEPDTRAQAEARIRREYRRRSWSETAERFLTAVQALPARASTTATAPRWSVQPSDIAALLRRTTDKGHPNINPLWTALNDIDLVKFNIKNFGYELGRTLARTMPPPQQTKARHVGISSRVCVQAEIETDWFAHWCSELKIPIVFHRKLWEYGFLLQTLFDAGLLQAGKRGIGFGCGVEPIPSYLASRGVTVTMTELDPARDASRQWIETKQHLSAIEQGWKEHLVDRATFERHVDMKYVDMNAIPPDLCDYDFCWSICSLEHLGSIELGCRFVKNTLDVLKPGGWSIHTTEFNVDNDGPTIDNWVTVLFQRRHLESLASELTAAGHMVAPLSFDPGSGPFDRFVDLPPYDFERFRQSADGTAGPNAIGHLKLSIDGFAAT